MTIQKSEIQLDATRQPLNAYLVSPSSAGPGVLVLPSWFGLRPYFKSPQPTNGMVENLEAAGVDVTTYNYPGTRHWFMVEDRPEYDAAATALAWERTLEFLKQSLQ